LLITPETNSGETDLLNQNISNIEKETDQDNLEEKDNIDINIGLDKSKPKDPSEDYFSEIKFESMNLSKGVLKALKESNFEVATEIQSKCIPEAMRGCDLMGAAKTGSGKSLAFLIPAVEMLIRTNFSDKNGTGVIVLTPTRELAIQLCQVAKDLLKYANKKVAVVMGGNNRKTEVEKLTKGVQLLIATPGRLIDHLKDRKQYLNIKNLQMLIIDEADAILKIG